jgi:oligopeptide/dipeptide ABC transporter ATP-binding protein
MRLLPAGAHLSADTLSFRQRDLLAMSEGELRAIRGCDIAMVLQDPLSALDPVCPVGEQIAETLRCHRRLGRRAAWRRAVELLAEAGVPDASRRAREYRDRLSGGMKQRALIAMAVACRPSLLIADEPTTALDVSVQAQILELLLRLRSELGMSMLLIAHDLGVVAQACDRVAVMYAGRIVESTTVERIFESPAHPYTHGLMRSVPRLRPAAGAPSRLEPIPGTVPSISAMPSGCPFHPRCRVAQAECSRVVPDSRELAPGHLVRCHLAGRSQAREARP